MHVYVFAYTPALNQALYQVYAHDIKLAEMLYIFMIWNNLDCMEMQLSLEDLVD